MNNNLNHNLNLYFSKKYKVSNNHILFKHYNIIENKNGFIWVCSPINSEKKYILKVFLFEKNKFNNENESNIHSLISNFDIGPEFIKDFQLNTTTGCIIMEYCDADLFSYGIENKLNKEQIKDIMSQALNKLYLLHELGFMHLDIKTENIFIDKDGIVKLGDFGFTTQRLEYYENNVGTKLFLAPETQLPKKLRRYNNKCDVWSMGVTFYCLLTHNFPFTVGQINKFVKNLKNNEKMSVDIRKKNDYIDAITFLQEKVFVESDKRITSKEFFDYVKFIF